MIRRVRSMYLAFQNHFVAGCFLVFVAGCCSPSRHNLPTQHAESVHLGGERNIIGGGDHILELGLRHFLVEETFNSSELPYEERYDCDTDGTGRNRAR